jgi:hypothetical protein
MTGVRWMVSSGLILRDGTVSERERILWKLAFALVGMLAGMVAALTVCGR